jgi:uncharacterized protein YndB with AHSA1/START domain
MVRHHPNSSQLAAETLEARSPARPKPVALCEVRRDTDNGRTTVVIIRQFAAPREAVWSLLTSPEQLRLWAPHTTDHRLTQIGRVTFTLLGDDIDGHADIPEFELSGVVLAVDAPTLLEHSWAMDVLAWHLEDAPAGTAAGTRVILRHTLANDVMASAVAAGWHLCFDVADSVLEGQPKSPMRGPGAMNHGWADLNRRYAKVLGVTPTKLG